MAKIIDVASCWGVVVVVWIGLSLLNTYAALQLWCRFSLSKNAQNTEHKTNKCTLSFFEGGGCKSSCQSHFYIYPSSPSPFPCIVRQSVAAIPSPPELRPFFPGLWLAWRYSCVLAWPACLYTGGEGRDWLSQAQSHTLTSPWIRPHSRIAFPL